ncbi:MAG: 6-carboxyhexanoate--CoA ligase [Treponema sp.]|nr:6-carboxyhexanoate--CoA ligase [Treponema sp.]
MFSVKMRSSLGGKNGINGKHISGAERIVSEEEVENTVLRLLERARNHQRGKADFINLKIQEVKDSESLYIPLLSVYSKKSSTKKEGRKMARDELLRIGVSEKSVRSAFEILESLKDSMRGAIILDSQSGKRLDTLKDRGVRCSNMDAANKKSYEEKLFSQGLSGEHAREALVLASKVASAKGSVAELCWSDDPDYVTGYVASSKFGYCRISVMKDLGDFVGGRVFFVDSDCDIDSYIEYLQNKVVLVKA